MHQNNVGKLSKHLLSLDKQKSVILKRKNGSEREGNGIREGKYADESKSVNMAVARRSPIG